MAQTPVLWQIKVSHYNEKARWALDYKGLEYRRRTPWPPLFVSLPVAWVLTRGTTTTTPVVRLDGKAIGDSTRIIAALEQRNPDPPLYPSDPEQRARALELEEYFDEQLAPQIRQLVWLSTAPHPRTFLAAAMPDTSPAVLAALRPGAALTAALVKRRYGANDGVREEAKRKVRAAMERIEAEQGPDGYLVGDAFSVADLAAAALFSPLIQPPERPFLPPVPYPEPLLSLQQELCAMPGAEWVREMYRRHRGAYAGAGR
jgi:glutathione S-transferase